MDKLMLLTVSIRGSDLRIEAASLLAAGGEHPTGRRLVLASTSTRQHVEQRVRFQWA